MPLTCAQQIQALLAFFDESVRAGTLVGTGPGKSGVHRLAAFRNLLVTVQFTLEQKNYGTAAALLRAAVFKSDGQCRPGDFVSGPAVAELQIRLQQLMEALKKQ